MAREMAATSTSLVQRSEVQNDGLQPQSVGNVIAEIPIDPALFEIQLPSGQLNPFGSYPPLESSEGVDQIIRYGEYTPFRPNRAILARERHAVS